MLKRIIEQYVAPLAAAAAGGASGAGAAGGAAGAAGGSAGGAAGGSAGGAAGGAAGEAAGGSIGSDAVKTVAGGKGPDLVTEGIRSAAKTVTTPINMLSSIPESAGGRYRADLERIRAQRYASGNRLDLVGGLPKDFFLDGGKAYGDWSPHITKDGPITVYRHPSGSMVAHEAAPDLSHHVFVQHPEGSTYHFSKDTRPSGGSGREYGHVIEESDDDGEEFALQDRGQPRYRRINTKDPAHADVMNVAREVHDFFSGQTRDQRYGSGYGNMISRRGSWERWYPAVSHDESGDVHAGRSHEHALNEARKAGLPHDSSLYTFGFVDRDGDFYSQDEIDDMDDMEGMYS